MAHFFIKKLQEVVKTTKKKEPIYNNNKNKVDDMKDTKEKIELAKEILAQSEENISNVRVKKIKKDKGLIERTEQSKTILTEDNKELLID